MPEENVRRIVPARDGGWRVTAPAGQRASAWCASQAEAQMRARQILRNTGGGELLVVDESGAVLASEAVGAPPPPIAGARHKLVREARSGYGRTSC